MDEGVGLRLGSMVTFRKGAGIEGAAILGRFPFGHFGTLRMAGGEMLVVRGFLDKPAVFTILTIPAGKFEILEMCGFNVIIHGILFFANLWTMGALKVAIVETDVVVRHFGNERGRKGEEEGCWDYRDFWVLRVLTPAFLDPRGFQFLREPRFASNPS